MVRAIRGDELDEHGLQDYHITLRADQAVALANRLLKLAEVAQEPVPAAAAPPTDPGRNPRLLPAAVMTEDEQKAHAFAWFKQRIAELTGTELDANGELDVHALSALPTEEVEGAMAVVQAEVAALGGIRRAAEHEEEP